MSNFYAVLKGRVPGIYTDWNECKKQTDGFSGPVFRKFPTRGEAEKFLKLDPARSYPSASAAKPLPPKEKTKKVHLIGFVRAAFNMAIKIFRVSEETMEKIAQAIWDDLENADEGDPKIFRDVLQEYLPLPDCLYRQSLYTFLDENLGYGQCIDLFRTAYIKDGGKQIRKEKNQKPAEIVFDDSEGEDEDDGVGDQEKEKEKEEEGDQPSSCIDLTSILYSDGAHNKVTGDEAWGSVVNKNEQDIMSDYIHLFPDMKTKVEDLPVGTRRIIVAKFNDVASQQINGAELLALVAALRAAIFSKGKVKIIRCDSKLMTDYWSRNLKADSRAKMDLRKAKYVDELICLRKEFEKMGGVIEKISGDDNPADCGWHK
ncbi:MAG: RNase H1/viroplasmin domain-containing protein [Candidatus Colwellbacteria bacterium]|nr:RNase H1/viroplasmin domain-containing protein [Candidatus Colwellbacteria bacterium]